MSWLLWIVLPWTLGGGNATISCLHNNNAQENRRHVPNILDVGFFQALPPVSCVCACGPSTPMSRPPEPGILQACHCYLSLLLAIIIIIFGCTVQLVDLSSLARDWTRALRVLTTGPPKNSLGDIFIGAQRHYGALWSTIYIFFRTQFSSAVILANSSFVISDLQMLCHPGIKIFDIISFFSVASWCSGSMFWS